MNPRKLDEIRSWWTQIETLEKEGKAVDLFSFADSAHIFIPLLLKELEQFSRTDRDPETHNRQPRIEVLLLSKPRRRNRMALASLYLPTIPRQLTLPLEGPSAPTPEIEPISSSFDLQPSHRRSA